MKREYEQKEVEAVEGRGLTGKVEAYVRKDPQTTATQQVSSQIMLQVHDSSAKEGPRAAQKLFIAEPSSAYQQILDEIEEEIGEVSESMEESKVEE